MDNITAADKKAKFSEDLKLAYEFILYILKVIVFINFLVNVRTSIGHLLAVKVLLKHGIFIINCILFLFSLIYYFH